MNRPTTSTSRSIVWLEGFLKAMPGALLMTSHDRDFMNRVVTRVADIDDGEITSYSGNYDFYERERALRAANREAAFARQQAMLAKEQRFIDRFAANAAKAGQVQSRVKALEKIEKIELPKRRAVVKFDFRPPPRSGDDVVAIRGLRKAYGSRVLYDGFDLTVRRGERWSVMGRNGAGKTTLLKMIAGVLAPDAGEVALGASLKLGYFAQQALQVLDANLTVWEQMQRDFPHDTVGVLRSLLGAFQFSGDEIDKPIRALSGGERTRLVIARMLFDPPNFLVLDEPTNHLDLLTKDMLIEALGSVRGHCDDLRVARSFVSAGASVIAYSETGRRHRHRHQTARLPRLLPRIRRPDRTRSPKGSTPKMPLLTLDHVHMAFGHVPLLDDAESARRRTGRAESPSSAGTGPVSRPCCGFCRAKAHARCRGHLARPGAHRRPARPGSGARHRPVGL